MDMSQIKDGWYECKMVWQRLKINMSYRLKMAWQKLKIKDGINMRYRLKMVWI